MACNNDSAHGRLCEAALAWPAAPHFNDEGVTDFNCMSIAVWGYCADGKKVIHLYD